MIRIIINIKDNKILFDNTVPIRKGSSLGSFPIWGKPARFRKYDHQLNPNLYH